MWAPRPAQVGTASDTAASGAGAARFFCGFKGHRVDGHTLTMKLSGVSTTQGCAGDRLSVVARDRL